MAADAKPERPPFMGLIDADDPGHIRLTVEQARYYVDTIQRQVSRIATLEALNAGLVDELDKARASRDAYKAQLEGRTRDLMAHHEEAVRALNGGTT